MDYLQSLFGLSKDEIRQWPGISIYCRYLELCFQPLLSHDYSSLWKAIGKIPPGSQRDCWTWVTDAVVIMRAMEDADSSIEDIWNSLIKPRNSTKLDVQQKAACHLAVFAVLCWGTMILQPRLDSISLSGTPTLMVLEQGSGESGLNIHSVRRPMPALFRHFGRIISTTGHHTATLHVASLNYASLKMIGKVSLVWTNSLSKHLDFDAANRRLPIFKFPSFCALSTYNRQATPIFEG